MRNSQFINIYSDMRSNFDDYPTHPLNVEALLLYEDFGKRSDVLEPCVGDGNIAKTLEKHGHKVTGFDIQERKGIYGEKGINFLTYKKKHDYLITNPPFRFATHFIIHGISIIKKKMAMLLRLDFLTSMQRYKNIYAQTPPSRVLIFTTPMPWLDIHSKQWRPGGFPLAWYVWDKHSDNNNLMNSPIIRWINLRASADGKSFARLPVYYNEKRGIIIIANDKKEARFIMKERLNEDVSLYIFNKEFKLANKNEFIDLYYSDVDLFLFSHKEINTLRKKKKCGYNFNYIKKKSIIKQL